jgi:hypothetical protein
VAGGENLDLGGITVGIEEIVDASSAIFAHN